MEYFSEWVNTWVEAEVFNDTTDDEIEKFDSPFQRQLVQVSFCSAADEFNTHFR